MIDGPLLHRLYIAANGARWRVSEARFAIALERSAACSFGDHKVDPADVEARCSALHLADLALACACDDGNDEAWQHFVVTYRPVLHRAADAIDPTGAARELADAIYGDLYGTRERDGERQSLFRYFHGRSSLATWLRSVLAQRHVDRMRQRRFSGPLPEDDSLPLSMTSTPSGEPDRPRLIALMEAVMTTALALLAPRDRLRLGCYYAQRMTLAQVGRLTGEHEATVSRQLARTRKAIREAAERLLSDDHGLGPAEIDDCFEAIAEDPGTLDLAALLSLDGKESSLDRSTRGTRT